DAPTSAPEGALIHDGGHTRNGVPRTQAEEGSVRGGRARGISRTAVLAVGEEAGLRQGRCALADRCQGACAGEEEAGGEEGDEADDEVGDAHDGGAPRRRA